MNYRPPTVSCNLNYSSILQSYNTDYPTAVKKECFYKLTEKTITRWVKSDRAVGSVDLSPFGPYCNPGSGQIFSKLGTEMMSI